MESPKETPTFTFFINELKVISHRNFNLHRRIQNRKLTLVRREDKTRDEEGASEGGDGKPSVAARKPRAGWRNRNYLARLSEATEEKGLVARVSCGRRLKYRKFKHRSTPPSNPLLYHSPAPLALDLHFVYRFFRLSSFPVSSRSPFPPRPESRSDRPRFSASGKRTPVFILAKNFVLSSKRIIGGENERSSSVLSSSRARIAINRDPLSRGRNKLH